MGRRFTIIALTGVLAWGLSSCSAEDTLTIINTCDTAVQVFTGWEDHASVIVEAAGTAKISGFWHEGSAVLLPGSDVEVSTVRVATGPGNSYEATIPTAVCGAGASDTVDVVVARVLADGDLRIDVYAHGHADEALGEAFLQQSGIESASTSLDGDLARVRVEIPDDGEVDTDAVVSAAVAEAAGSPLLFDCRTYPCRIGP